VIRISLEGKESNLRPVSVGDHELVADREAGEGRGSGGQVATLGLGFGRLASSQQGVAAQRHDKPAHASNPCVSATRSAASVGMRFADCAQTAD
jgi:hypothetical protein